MADSVTLLKNADEQPLPLVRLVQPATLYPVEALGSILGEAAIAIHEHVQSPLAMELSPDFGDGRAGQAAAVLG